MKFDRNKHVFHLPGFEEIIKDTIRFFNGTPVQSIPVPEQFHGAGVYAIYCTAKTGIYKNFHEINRTAFHLPIYVGKAVPKGWRQGRAAHAPETPTYELNNRIREHGRSLEQGAGINPDDFCCRFVIFEDIEQGLISTVEAALIRIYQPVWNSLIDGFGNHDPGSGRYEQAMSDWDVCHPGRLWAERCKGKHNSRAELVKRIETFMSQIIGEQ